METLEVFIHKNIYKVILVLIASIILIACDEDLEENRIEFEEALPVEESTPVDEVTYERESYSFNGNIVLSENLYVRARHVHFKAGGSLKVNSYNLNIEAETVTFEGGSNVLAYSPTEYASCKSNGLKAGLIEIIADRVEGVPTIDLAGQNAGQIGIYNGTRVSQPVDKTHEALIRQGEIWYKGCVTYLRGKYPKDVPELFIPKQAGQSGALLISSKNYEDFKPIISNRVPHGSYEALIEGSTGKISWWRVAAKGSDGLPGKVCFDIAGEYLCK